METLVADANQVAFAYTSTGTNSGPFHGHDATGKTLVERWGSSDELGITKQLGLVWSRHPDDRSSADRSCDSAGRAHRHRGTPSSARIDLLKATRWTSDGTSSTSVV